MLLEEGDIDTEEAQMLRMKAHADMSTARQARAASKTLQVAAKCPHMFLRRSKTPPRRPKTLQDYPKTT